MQNQSPHPSPPLPPAARAAIAYLVLPVLLFLLGCGALIEVLQIPVPGRATEAADMYANVIGLLIGWGLLRAGLSEWCVWLERKRETS